MADARHISAFDKRRIAATLNISVRSALLRRIDAATQRFWDAAVAECHWESGEIVERRSRRWLVIVKRKLARGRPRKNAMRPYMTELLDIYKAATGKRMTRISKTYNVNPFLQSQHEKKNPFLLACMKAAGVPTYPKNVIREILKEK